MYCNSQFTCLLSPRPCTTSRKQDCYSHYCTQILPPTLQLLVGVQNMLHIGLMNGLINERARTLCRIICITFGSHCRPLLNPNLHFLYATRKRHLQLSFLGNSGKQQIHKQRVHTAQHNSSEILKSIFVIETKSFKMFL